jgi:uncharacterized protein YwqG
MGQEEIIRKLEPWRAKNRRPAWKPVVELREGPLTASKFCGSPWVGPGATWPICRCCAAPRTLFLQLDLAKLPEELGRRFGTGLLQLFYCTRDNCQGNGGWEAFGDDLSCVRVIQANGPALPASSAKDEGFPAKQIVGWTRFDDLPSPGEHEVLGLSYDYDFGAKTLGLQCPELHFADTYPMDDCPAEIIANSQPGDKLSGWPFWIQGVEYPICPRCGRRMVLVFQVDSEENVPFMFGDGGCGHITQCPEHKEVVAFGWACC